MAEVVTKFMCKKCGDLASAYNSLGVPFQWIFIAGIGWMCKNCGSAARILESVVRFITSGND